MLYKKPGKYHLGLPFLNSSKDRGLGSDLDLGVTSTPGLGVSIIALFSMDLPHPGDYDLYIHHVLSIVFCVTHNLQPVHIHVGLG